MSADTTKHGRGRPGEEPDIAEVTVPLPKSGEAVQAIDEPPKRGRRSSENPEPSQQARHLEGCPSC